MLEEAVEEAVGAGPHEAPRAHLVLQAPRLVTVLGVVQLRSDLLGGEPSFERVGVEEGDDGLAVVHRAQQLAHAVDRDEVALRGCG